MGRGTLLLEVGLLLHNRSTIINCSEFNLGAIASSSPLSIFQF